MAEHKPCDTTIRKGEPPCSPNTPGRHGSQLAEPTTNRPPIGRVRRFSGIVLLGLGLVVIARMLWLVTFYHEGFGEAEWIRFYGLLALGTWFGLAGYWLAFRSRVALLVLLLSFAGVLLAGILHDLLMR